LSKKEKRNRNKSDGVNVREISAARSLIKKADRNARSKSAINPADVKAAMAFGASRVSPLRRSISASKMSGSDGDVTYSVPVKHGLQVTVSPPPTGGGGRATGGAVYDLLRSEMSRLRSNSQEDYL
jgi:hypothetical protein